MLFKYSISAVPGDRSRRRPIIIRVIQDIVDRTERGIIIIIIIFFNNKLTSATHYNTKYRSNNK